MQEPSKIQIARDYILDQLKGETEPRRMKVRVWAKKCGVDAKSMSHAMDSLNKKGIIRMRREGWTHSAVWFLEKTDG